MARKRRAKRSIISTFLIVSFALGAIFGAVVSSILLQGNPSLVLSPGDVYTRSITIVGIEQGGIGKLATLTVELRPGSGHLSVAVPPYENDDAQRAAVIARTAASSASGLNLDHVDILVSVENLSEETTVSGPSSSASVALLMLATINASEGKAPNNVRQGIVISASINEVGRLEPVGSIDAKYQAVAEAGVYNVFVVSKNQVNINSGSPDVSIEKVVDLNELAGVVLW